MKVLKILPCLIAAALLTAACVETPEEGESQLVVEGFIETGRPPVVMLHYSVVPGDHFESVDSMMREKIINWGRVSISDGTTEVQLAGRKDTFYMPPYIYTTAQMLGEEGKTYHLTAQYEGHTAHATTRVLPALHCDSIRVTRHDNGQAHITAWAQVTDPDMKIGLFGRYAGERQYVPCFMGMFQGDAAVDGLLEMPVYRNFQADGGKQSHVYFAADSIVFLKVAVLDDAAFRFWTTFRDISYSSDVIFFNTYGNLASNIEGGHGIWYGMGSELFRLDTHRDSLYRN